VVTVHVAIIAAHRAEATVGIDHRCGLDVPTRCEGPHDSPVCGREHVEAATVRADEDMLPCAQFDLQGTAAVPSIIQTAYAALIIVSDDT
jgi:hypothetical protein